MKNDKRKRKRIILDFDIIKDSCFVKSRCYWENDVYVQEVSRSYYLWCGINERCKGVGVNKSYLKCNNQFENYQSFAGWCNRQYGYLNKDSSGKSWEIDKDIFIDGNSEYSPDSCVFVPHWLNSLLIKNFGENKELPEGVYLYKSSRYRAQVSGGENRYLGTFQTPEQAHLAYLDGKLEVVQNKMLTEEDNHVLMLLRLIETRLKERRTRYVGDRFGGNDSPRFD